MRMVRYAAAAVLLVTAFILMLASSEAAELLRVGKAVPEAFSFVPLDASIRMKAVTKSTAAAA